MGHWQTTLPVKGLLNDKRSAMTGLDRSQQRDLDYHVCHPVMLCGEAAGHVQYANAVKWTSGR